MTETLHNITSLLEMALWRDGGQRRARRNAWAAMVSDRSRARARAEAEAALGAELAAQPAGTVLAARPAGRVSQRP